MIDEKIQDCVRIVNRKGYYTNGSCEGHFERTDTCTYICFKYDYPGIGNNVPPGFKYMKGKRGIFHDYNRSISKEAFEREKSDMLFVLTAWCKSLPEITK